MKAPTIRDLARELGLSETAVSQALHPTAGNVKLRPETAERVRQLAAKWNYRPNSFARGIRSRRFFNIGFFEARVHEEGTGFPGASAGIFHACHELGYNVTLVRMPPNTGTTETIPRALREAHLDALVISQEGGIRPEIEEAINRSRLPVVFLNAKHRQNAVYVDDVAGARLASRHLIEQGYRRILFGGVAFPDAHYSLVDRRRGYEESVAEAGLKPMLPGSRRTDEPDEETILRAMVEGKADAVQCYNSLGAVRLFQQLYRRGIRVPDDLAIVGYGGEPFDLEYPVPLTTVRIPFREMAYEAARMAISLVEGKARGIPSRAFLPALVVRDTTPPRAARRRRR